MELPKHIAIIMDGNGRWAKKRGLPRVAGHQVGTESIRAVVETCLKFKIKVLTLFAFSTENWGRPKEEVNYLMGTLFLKTFEEGISKLHKNHVCLQVIGDIGRLNKKLQQKISVAEELTKNNSALKLIIAISYSGRWDITEAVRKLCKKVIAGMMKISDITTNEITRHICLSDLPEPDLLIRTSGEQRISNFMLWQLAYTELYFTNILWPDFREKDLVDAIKDYSNRTRRFGK
ncbi:MAG: isoprenyl transferase [Coxiellaceae bacterium]|jgi:undecaprenyl diphosphate synthase|nr:isoprenyl transferase [Coxiellaceae bacterium]